jgi:hypothetical protein
MSEGQTLLIIVKDGRVIDFSWDMSLTHVEFVRRRRGSLPEGAWVGSVSKLDGQVVAISSKTFYGYQLPASDDVARAVRAVFK